MSNVTSYLSLEFDFKVNGVKFIGSFFELGYRPGSDEKQNCNLKMINKTELLQRGKYIAARRLF